MLNNSYSSNPFNGGNNFYNNTNDVYQDVLKSTDTSVDPTTLSNDYSTSIYGFSQTGKTLYFQVFRHSDGYAYDTNAVGYSSSATWANRAITMTEDSNLPHKYEGTFPASDAGSYHVIIYEQDGGSPAETDVSIGGEKIFWSGVGTISPVLDDYGYVKISGTKNTIDNINDSF